MINIFKNAITSDSQLIGIHNTIKKNQIKDLNFGTILSFYLSDCLNEAIKLSYQSQVFGNDEMQSLQRN